MIDMFTCVFFLAVNEWRRESTSKNYDNYEKYELKEPKFWTLFFVLWGEGGALHIYSRVINVCLWLKDQRFEPPYGSSKGGLHERTNTIFKWDWFWKYEIVVTKLCKYLIVRTSKSNMFCLDFQVWNSGSKSQFKFWVLAVDCLHP